MNAAIEVVCDEAKIKISVLTANFSGLASIPVAALSMNGSKSSNFSSQTSVPAACSLRCLALNSSLPCTSDISPARHTAQTERRIASSIAETFEAE